MGELFFKNKNKKSSMYFHFVEQSWDEKKKKKKKMQWFEGWIRDKVGGMDVNQLNMLVGQKAKKAFVLCRLIVASMSFHVSLSL